MWHCRKYCGCKIIQRVLTLCCSIQAVKTAWTNFIFRYYPQLFRHYLNIKAAKKAKILRGCNVRYRSRIFLLGFSHDVQTKSRQVIDYLTALKPMNYEAQSIPIRYARNVWVLQRYNP